MQTITAAILASAIAISAAQKLPVRTELPREGAIQGEQRASHETAHLTIRTSSSAESAAPGQKLVLQVDVTPKAKMHVYAPGQDGYIPISLTLQSNPDLTTAKARYPAGEKLFMAALNETQIVYGKPFRVTQEVTLARTPDLRARAAKDAASLTIKGTVRYQACDDRICYLPANVPVEWTVKLAPAK